LARPVLDDDRLAPGLAQPLDDQPPEHVERPARRGRHNDPDGVVWKAVGLILRRRASAPDCGRAERGGHDETLQHRGSPLLVFFGLGQADAAW
jgi:hypothetical protein